MGGEWSITAVVKKPEREFPGDPGAKRVPQSGTWIPQAATKARCSQINFFFFKKSFLSTSACSQPRHTDLHINLSLAKLGTLCLCVCVCVLDKGSANIFLQGSNSKYFRHCGPYSFHSSHSELPSHIKATRDSMFLHCMPIKLYLWNRNLNFI